MKKLMLFLAAICLFSAVKAQDENAVPKEQNPTVAIAIVPQSFAYNTAEINLDLRLADRQWLTIAPLFQFDDNQTNYFYDANDAITSGIGLGLNYRYFPLTRRVKRFSDGRGPFVAAGLRGLTTSYEYNGNSYNYYSDAYNNAGLLPAETIYKDRVFTNRP